MEPKLEAIIEEMALAEIRTKLPTGLLRRSCQLLARTVEAGFDSTPEGVARQKSLYACFERSLGDFNARDKAAVFGISRRCVQLIAAIRAVAEARP